VFMYSPLLIIEQLTVLQLILTLRQI